ncbi:MAG: ImmA/IrrE family metallo-endopeptidase [Gemmatales bacterium]
MKNLEDLEHCAATFWEPIPERNSFPRDVERYLPIHYAASIESMQGLTTQRAYEWLSAKGFARSEPPNNRRLDGCIIAQKGHAVLFIDSALSVDERRMIVAHETAHFWIDYELPRRRMKLRYGERGLQLLDQESPAETVEVLMSTAMGAPIQAFYHYQFKEQKQETEVEQRANTLACLLIAPRKEVIARARTRHIAREDKLKWLELLHQAFGVPENWARGYLPLLQRNYRDRAFSSWFLPSIGKCGNHDA